MVFTKDTHYPMPTVNPAFRYESGSPGAKASYSPGATITATIDAPAGIDSVHWEVASTDETTLPTDYTLVQSGVRGEIVTLTAGAAGTAGILAATVNNGVDPQTGSPSPAMTATAKWYVPTNPGSLEVGCVNERFESDPTFGSTGEINGAIRGVGVGSPVTFAAVKTALAAADDDIDVNGQKVTGLGTPTASTDAATKGYADSLVAPPNVSSTGDPLLLARFDSSGHLTAVKLQAGADGLETASYLAILPVSNGSVSGNITPDAVDPISGGSYQRYTATGAIAFQDPTSFPMGAELHLEVTQSGGPSAITFTSGYIFPKDGTTDTQIVSTRKAATGQTDYYGFHNRGAGFVCFYHTYSF